LDFGRSFVDEQPVRARLAEALRKTLLLAGLALLLTYLVAVPLGVHAAVRRGSRSARWVGVLSFGLYALPQFWVALGLILLFAGGEGWQLLPLRGLSSSGLEGASLWTRGWDLGWHLILPVSCLAYPPLLRTTRLVRGAMLEVLAQDYVRAARAQGLPERVIIWKHALKNALVPVSAHLSIDLPMVIGGSVIIERIFTIPGMGMLIFDSILRRDYPVVMGVTAVAALMCMAAILLGDLVHLWLDPRSRA
jgi:peptide/nickel transport system permease protein